MADPHDLISTRSFELVHKVREIVDRIAARGSQSINQQADLILRAPAVFIRVDDAELALLVAQVPPSAVRSSRFSTISAMTP